ncbi:MAG: hypothetical protein V1870_00745 [Candidatus Aenigmatarchaeota archaeon]
MVYQIPKNPKVLKAFKYANENVPDEIRLSDMKRVCEKNLKNWQIPIDYQYVWFCLHNTRVSRTFVNMRTTSSEISFHAISVESNKKIKYLLNQAITKVGLETFSNLSCIRKSSIKDWIKGLYKPHITAILKACQIFDINPWLFLNGLKLYGWGSSYPFVFSYKEQEEMLDIIPWIVNEGHMRIDDPTIQIKQHESGLSALQTLQQRLKNLGINNVKIITKIDRKRDMCCMKIYSAALRQILTLRYGIDIGYKCKSANFEIKDLTKEKTLRILARDMETEGSFMLDKSHGFGYPKISFCSSNYQNAYRFYNMLKSIGYRPQIPRYDSSQTYKVVLKQKAECIRLVFEILPYIIHKKKIIDIIRIFSDPRILQKLRFDGSDIQKLMDVAINKFPNLSDELRKQGLKTTKRIVQHWKYSETTPSLIEILEITKLLNKSVFNYIPEWASLVLYIQNKVSLTQVEKFRKMKMVLLNDRNKSSWPRGNGDCYSC